MIAPVVAVGAVVIVYTAVLVPNPVHVPAIPGAVIVGKELAAVVSMKRLPAL
ncbi:hypothetical protein D3C81_929550 [compost metagenome]